MVYEINFKLFNYLTPLIVRGFLIIYIQKFPLVDKLVFKSMYMKFLERDIELLTR